MGPGYGCERKEKEIPVLDLLHLHCQALLPRTTTVQLLEKLNPYMSHNLRKDFFLFHLTTTMSK